MFPGSADRFEALPQIPFLLLAEGIQLLGGADLCDLDLSYVLLKPVHEFRHSDAVLDVRVDDILDLSLVLHRLH